MESDLSSPGMLLAGRRGQIMYWSPFGGALLPALNKHAADPNENFNLCIAGVPGSGKSVFMAEHSSIRSNIWAAECASMLDLFNSKFIFRVSDQVTAYKSALTLGEQEIIETQENLSYGSNTMRDGVNMNNVERKKLLVVPSEIINLPDLTCYVKLAGNFPITKLTMQLQNLNTAFVCEYKLLKKLKLVEY
ncbi:type IV secretion-system coupling DNA-binding domain protein [Orientia tsutsugamushi str. Gilliam]|uniref:Type IV secretion-system coupling DNA-binding domain protein n=1 Tax=Orientia tsutsugamushi str. Gilliam TaxID=1359184 RepID=A0A0F3M9Y0_ORITS|nr:type IV secretion-system coupling DNA-binding domain protein [Orientia tsutsugamushi str. Gilliam]